MCVYDGRKSVRPDVKIGLVGPPCEGIKGDEAQMTATARFKSLSLRASGLKSCTRFTGSRSLPVQHVTQGAA